VIVWSAWRAWALWRTGPGEGRARGALIGYCAGQIVFVIGISSMATYLESSRYRFQVEPFIWLLVALLFVSLVPYGRVPDRRHV
jgi:Ca2+/Na+ antiporter